MIPIVDNSVTNKRIEWIDLSRFIAIICVVIIHTQGGFLGSPHGSRLWWIFNIINSLAHFSVPLFVMISGTLLLLKEEDTIVFYKKRLYKIVLPFLFWSIVMFIGNIVDGKALSKNSIVLSLFYDMLNNRVHGVYWFIYMLIGLYLITPILVKWLNNARNVEIELYLSIWVVTLFFNMIPNFKCALEMQYFTGFIGYYILGHYINRKTIEKKCRIILSLILVVIGSLITIVGNYLFNYISFESYLTPNIMMLSAGVYILLKDSTVTRMLGLNRLVRKISDYSYGIYLIHVVFISLLVRVGVNCQILSPYIGSFVFAFIVIIATVMFIEIIKNIPLAKYVIGLEK